MGAEFGKFPAQYNPRVHGPYCPWRYYGPKDTPISEVKLGELGSWISRRDKSPAGIARLFGRGFHRWNHTWMHCKDPKLAGFAQIVCAIMLVGMFKGHDHEYTDRGVKYYV